MNPTLYRENTRLIVILFSGLLALTLIRIFYNTVAGTTLPLDKGLVGFVVIGVLFAFYQNNNLWSRITANPWVLLFLCLHCSLLRLWFVSLQDGARFPSSTSGSSPSFRV